MLEKTCTKCGETKPVADFARLTTGKHGVRGNCKECQRRERLSSHGWRGPSGRVTGPALEVLRDV